METVEFDVDGATEHIRMHQRCVGRLCNRQRTEIQSQPLHIDLVLPILEIGNNGRHPDLSSREYERVRAAAAAAVAVVHVYVVRGGLSAGGQDHQRRS